MAGGLRGECTSVENSCRGVEVSEPSRAKGTIEGACWAIRSIRKAAYGSDSGGVKIHHVNDACVGQKFELSKPVWEAKDGVV